MSTFIFIRPKLFANYFHFKSILCGLHLCCLTACGGGVKYGIELGGERNSEGSTLKSDQDSGKKQDDSTPKVVGSKLKEGNKSYLFPDRKNLRKN